MVFEGVLTTLTAPLLALGPLWSIAVVSILVGTFSTLAYKYMTDQVLLKEYKAEIKKNQAAMKNVDKSDMEKMKGLQKRAMEANMKLMSQTFKPMLITIIPFILIFRWLRATFEGLTIVSFPATLPVLGDGLGWLGTYLIFSLVFTTAIRKALKVV
jgi:uncharacterized membrane protein (DUF106 family)